MTALRSGVRTCKGADIPHHLQGSGAGQNAVLCTVFFHRRLIVLHCLWCRGASPYQYVVYLINNVNDPVCGCNVTGHKVSALEGQVLEKWEERGFEFTLQGWWFPSSSHCRFPHPPKLLPRLHHGAAHTSSHHRLGYPQGITHRGGDFRTLCVPCVQTGKALGWLALEWFPGVRCTCLQHGVGWALSWFTPSQFCAALKDPVQNFSFGAWRWEELPSPLMGMKCLNVTCVFPGNPSQNIEFT